MNTMTSFLTAKSRKFRDAKEGTTIVEFAFVFPVFVSLVMGLFYLGMGFFGIHQAQAATDKAARIAYTMDAPTSSQIQELVASQLGTVMGGTFTPAVQMTDKYGQTYANIEITYEYLPVIPFMPEVSYKTKVSSEVLVRDLP